MVGANNTFQRALHQKERITTDLKASRDNLIFTWTIIDCTGEKHWGKVR